MLVLCLGVVGLPASGSQAAGVADARPVPACDSFQAQRGRHLPGSPIERFLCGPAIPAVPAPDGAPPSAPVSLGSPETADPPICLPIPGTDDRCEVWTAAYDNPDGHEDDGTTGYAGIDRPLALAVAPTGNRVFVTGISFDSVTGYDAVTAAYDAATGAELWVARHDGPGAKALYDGGTAIVVSGDGSKVYVAGYRDYETRPSLPKLGELLTIAYDAATGAELWVRGYDGSPRGDLASTIALSPDGRGLFVGGVIDARVGAVFSDIGTVAYDPQTGERLWVAVHDGGFGDFPLSVGVSPDGERVLVGGTAYYPFNPPSSQSLTLEHVALAYAAGGEDAGSELWSARYHPVTAQGMGTTAQGMGVAFGPDAVYITGTSDNPATQVWDAVGETTAFDAATGERRWVRTTSVGAATAVLGGAASADGDRVFVTGLVTDSLSVPTIDYDFGTWALDAGTGQQAWFSRYRGIRDDWAWGTSVAAPRDGGRIFVAGISVTFAVSQLGPPLRGDYATLAYNAATGAQVWAGRYNGSPAMTDLDHDTRVSVRAALGGQRAFTAGNLIHQPGGVNASDYGIGAYDAT